MHASVHEAKDNNIVGLFHSHGRHYAKDQIGRTAWYVIRTRSWDALVEFYRELISKGWAFVPMLRLVEVIATSPAAAQLRGATSHSDLLLSDCADFRSGDSTLSIVYEPRDGTFLFRHRSFSSHDDQKTCTEVEALQTLRLFLRLKYGVSLETTAA